VSIEGDWQYKLTCDDQDNDTNNDDRKIRQQKLCAQVMAEIIDHISSL
jgi:hypothetical protein